jgi:glycosyltransferase involved in cell wall biosynthesis
MRINFVITNASLAGGTRVIVTQARELIKRGHQVQCFSTPPAPYSFRKRLSTLMRGHGWPAQPRQGPSYFDDSDVPHAVLPCFRPIIDRDLPDADVVVATWWQTAEWVNRLSPAKGAKAFFLQHYENWGGPEYRVDAAWRLPLHKIVISSWLREIARAKFGDNDVSLVPNSVDMTLFNAQPRGRQTIPTVGMLYNSIWFKGCDVAMKAFDAARKSIPNLRLVAFGEKAADSWLPVPEGTNYTVRPPQNSIKNIYSQCDVWMCGSRADGFFLPMLEAMACRCPVVSTKVGGPVDTIEDGKNGHLVDIEDHISLADRVVRVLTLSDLEWRKMSDAAYATACRYTWQDAARRMEEALETAIARSRGLKKTHPQRSDLLRAV